MKTNSCENTKITGERVSFKSIKQHPPVRIHSNFHDLKNIYCLSPKILLLLNQTCDWSFDIFSLSFRKSGSDLYSGKMSELQNGTLRFSDFFEDGKIENSSDPKPCSDCGEVFMTNGVLVRKTDLKK
jgi:hypothetical protein